MSSEVKKTGVDGMFCHAVYTASHVINRAYLTHLQPLGLTYPQYITLTLLWDCDGQKINELAQKLHMETSTLTPLVKRLEMQGHVVRKRGTKDRREVQVYLTPKGSLLREHAPNVTACMTDGTGMTRGELAELLKLLSKLREGLKPS